MQTKRRKRSRIRAAKRTAGHGHKKKNRGAGHRGGRGKAGQGKRGDAKLMKVTNRREKTLGKLGFTSLNKKIKCINIEALQSKLDTFLDNGVITKEKEAYVVDLNNLGYDKLLSKGQVRVKLNIIVKYASQNVVKKVEKAGGKVEVLNTKEN